MSYTLFIRYKNVLPYQVRHRTFYLRNKKGGLNKINETIRDYKIEDSFKNVKDLKRAEDIILSHNPSNILSARFADREAKIKTERRSIKILNHTVSKHEVIWK